MVQPTVLRKRHSLKGLKLLPVIKKVKGGRPEGLKEFARMSKEKKTDVLELEEIENIVNSLTGENMIELLELAGRDIDVNEARWLLHCLIIFANEVGQPRGQALDDSTDPSTSASTGGSSTPVPLETAGPSKKRKHDVDTTLEERILSLEKTSKGEMVQELKEKVRTLCLQDDPSNALILLTLDELAKAARKLNHEEADMFEELYRQANRYQSKLQISNLCLSVLGGKVADAISKAISKCLKDKPETKAESKNEYVETQKRPESPLNGLYPCQPSLYPMMPGMYPNMFNMGGV
ncbi:uncharacterized protein LOC128188950 isoform X2 [Crassostrea angulata]|uniref:uncharacterized protein LOC128188950 isoform X2 n=1 Tax=Magallana angulata TaxID=2784310 RepID=UPI0022B152D4|nr:uncharacterized protein LOC128188950 isoform X2 [Crassostrea angulata]